MYKILLLTFITLLVSCNKPIPNPELKDPIYNDINVRFAEASQLLAAEKKTLSGHEKDLAEAIPQTGQTILAQKKVFESKNKITKLEQEVQFLKLKVAARKKHAVEAYGQAFSKNEPWPDPKEWEQYQQEKNVRNKPKEWSVKNRLKETMGLSNDKKDEKAPGGH